MADLILEASQGGPLNARCMLSQTQCDLPLTPRHPDRRELRVDGGKGALDLKKIAAVNNAQKSVQCWGCLLYTSPSPRDS